MSAVVLAEVDFDAGGAAMTESFVVKLASSSDAVRKTAVAAGLYAAEVRFYQQIAPTVGVTVPECHFAEIDDAQGWFTLVMRHQPTATVGDMVAPGTVAHAAAALRELVALQAPRWDDPRLGVIPWLQPAGFMAFAETFPQSLAPFLQRFGDQLTNAEIILCEAVMPHVVPWMQAWGGPAVLQHGDFRPDNILFDTDGAGTDILTVFDWQAARIGPPLLDVGNYVGGSLAIEDRREHSEDLIRLYHEGLLAAGVRDFSWDDCWEDYRRTSLYGVFSYVGSSQYVLATERGDALYLEAFRRFAAQALDLDAARYVP
jgi:aminoglycoside/choline kinase family phosphotransferase